MSASLFATVATDKYGLTRRHYHALDTTLQRASQIQRGVRNGCNGDIFMEKKTTRASFPSSQVVPNVRDNLSYIPLDFNPLSGFH